MGVVVTDTSPAAVAARVKHMRFCRNNHDADLIEAIASQLAAANARADAAEYRIVHIAAGLFPGGFDNNVAAIRDALRDKPAPVVMVQEAAKVLLAWLHGGPETTKAKDVVAFFTAMYRGKGDDFEKVVAALRAIAGGNDE